MRSEAAAEHRVAQELAPVIRFRWGSCRRGVRRVALGVVADRLPACEIGAIRDLKSQWRWNARAIYQGRQAAAERPAFSASH